MTSWHLTLERAFVICSLALLLTGCRQPAGERAGLVNVVVEGGGGFPESLAGRWRASQHGWELVFELDGRLSSAVIGLGQVRVVPGRTTTVRTKTSEPAVFTPGEWTVHYVPATRALTVKITMAHVRVQMAGNLLEGSSTDVFAGPVSPAADSWQTQWTTFTNYQARAPDKTAFDLSTDPVYGEVQPLTFTKLAEPR